MGRPKHHLLSWKQLRPGHAVTFYTGTGWKKGTVIAIHDSHCTILHENGTDTRSTNVYDKRNVGLI